MASLNVSGFDELIDELKAAGQMANEELVGEMLRAGAEEVKKAWKEVATERDFHDSGDMIESIGFARKPKDIADARIIEVYPQGTDKKTGVRNAEKAFLLHYGWSSFSPTHWVDEADERATEPAIKAMERVFNAHMGR